MTVEASTQLFADHAVVSATFKSTGDYEVALAEFAAALTWLSQLPSIVLRATALAAESVALPQLVFGPEATELLKDVELHWKEQHRVTSVMKAELRKVVEAQSASQPGLIQLPDRLHVTHTSPFLHSNGFAFALSDILDLPPGEHRTLALRDVPHPVGANAQSLFRDSILVAVYSDARFRALAGTSRLARVSKASPLELSVEWLLVGSLVLIPAMIIALAKAGMRIDAALTKRDQAKKAAERSREIVKELIKQSLSETVAPLAMSIAEGANAAFQDAIAEQLIDSLLATHEAAGLEHLHVESWGLHLPGGRKAP